MRLGIFGGTFDPPHVGHWLAALDASEALALDRLLFVPTAGQPFKQRDRAIVASPRDRLAMTRLMAAGSPGFGTDAVEIDRGGLSYTVDTLTALAERAAGDERFLLLGADAWQSFPEWREPETVLRLATVVVLQRGETVPAAAPPLLLATRRVDVSSSEIRARVRAGRTIRGFVPDAVRTYIERTGLYREDGHAETTD